MKIKSAKFHASAADLRACPAWAWREFAFVGRSNVGKSSLINMLCGKANLAKVSAVPGKTRLLNFFVINEAWSLVDLPGYGYAQVTQSRKFDFSVLIKDYLEQRDNLAGVFVLIDSRLPPQRIDLDFVAWLDGCRVPFGLVFTKADKRVASQVQANVGLFLTAISSGRAAPPEVLVSSSKTGSGRIGILKAIERLGQFHGSDAPPCRNLAGGQ
ncbi:MAG: ribosome biogenesis GTP-binding protein YihA/YsxC [Verrucomicrobia bacterium]|nr:ribosome biogenesis GTP-binding protein YihA/YsxC [Verrucomicrobiota bacterium]